MELDPFISLVTDQLVASAALGDERTQHIAAALATSVAGSVRLATMSAISAATDEINAAILDRPGTNITISLQLENDEPTIRVSELPPNDAPVAGDASDGDTSARISLRLPELLKAEIDTAANRESISVNAWLVRAARTALTPGRAAGHNSHHIRGWVTG